MATLAVLISWVRSLIRPRGRHRARNQEAAAHRPVSHPVAPPRPAPLQRHRVPRARSPYGLDEPLDGDAQRIVRPYVEREQWQRRRVLYAAVYLGLDLDTRMIHTGGIR